MMLKKLAVSGVITTALMTTACQSVNTTSGGAIGVDRSQNMAPSWLLSEKQVELSAAESYAKEVAKARQQNRLN
ncbi:MAG: M48 family peptidase, partial [Burkholderiales bacterium]